MFEENSASCHSEGAENARKNDKSASINASKEVPVAKILLN